VEDRSRLTGSTNSPIPPKKKKEQKGDHNHSNGFRTNAPALSLRNRPTFGDDHDFGRSKVIPAMGSTAYDSKRVTCKTGSGFQFAKSVGEPSSTGDPGSLFTFASKMPTPKLPITTAVDHVTATRSVTLYRLPGAIDDDMTEITLNENPAWTPGEFLYQRPQLLVPEGTLPLLATDPRRPIRPHYND